MVVARPTRLKFKSGYLESRKFQLLKSGILGFGIRNTTQEFGIPQRNGIWNPSFIDEESEIQYLESGTHGVESRIQDCLGLPYMGRE